MDLTDRWKAMNWQTSEFSYTKADLVAELRKKSTSDITKLLRAYHRQYIMMLLLTIITPLFGFLKPNEPEYLFSIGLVWSYCLILSGFLSVKFFRFKLPDLSLRTTDAIRALLALVRSINSFQTTFVVLYMPVVFLGSLFARLTYSGKRLANLLTDPFALTVILLSTALVIWSGKLVKRFMARRQCVALIAKLEDHQRALEEF